MNTPKAWKVSLLMAGVLMLPWPWPKLAYTNAPWSGLQSRFSVALQFLHDGQLLPGKEYIIWFYFENREPVRFFMAFDLFPAREGNRLNTVLEGRFGLAGPPIREPAP